MDPQDKLEFYFSPINIKKIHPNSTINFDLYIKSSGKFVLYKNKNLVVQADDLKRLTEHQVETLYIHNNDKKNYKNYLEGNIENFLNSEDVPFGKKAEALYESAINVIEDVFQNPRSGETIKRSKEIISHTVDFILTAPQAFTNLLKIRKHDFYTYTHSVNVCTFLVTLAQEIGVSDKEVLKEVGEGGLLHDLGKSRVPSQIINKKGKLTNTEWEIMRKHPSLGVDIAHDTRDISEVSLTIIGQHHEKLTGGGYPNGLKGSELDQYANMASIVDVYDALTTNRSYSPARTPMEAGHILLQSKDEFNIGILKIFIKMLAA
ncbi:MAG: HD domain-containing protein [bacterium]|nr:HD domain-containing protein [bacterium]